MALLRHSENDALKTGLEHCEPAAPRCESPQPQCGLRLLVCKDVTANMAEVAERRGAARASRSTALRGIEGGQTYEGQQEFFAVAARVAREGRLSRFVYVSEKLS